MASKNPNPAGNQRKTTTQTYGQTLLDANYQRAAEEGSGIVPNAHPNFEEPTPLDKAAAALKKMWQPKPRKVK
jgi:hypothetical protein